MSDDFRDVRNKVLAGLILAGLLAIVRAIWSTRWATWLLWIGAGLVLVFIGVTVWRHVSSRRRARAEARAAEHSRMLLDDAVPLAWVPGSDCEGTIDIENPPHSIGWPRTDHYGHCDRVEIVFMHAPPYRLTVGHDPSPSANWTPDTKFGIEVQWSGASAPDIVLYVSLSGVIMVYEADMDKAPREQIPRNIGPGEWITMVLEKRDDCYSVVINDEVVWGARRRHTKNSVNADVELWRENVRIRSRLFTNDSAARVIVREFKLGRPEE